MPQQIIIVAETTHAEYPEMHRDDIQLRRREKHSCKGWVDRWYLPPIPYDDIVSKLDYLGSGSAAFICKDNSHWR